MKESKKEMLKSLGFSEEVKNIEKNVCAFCGTDKVKPEDFRDNISLREYYISGLCQTCMDKIFGE